MKFLTLAEARRIPESRIQYREDIWFGLLAQSYDKKFGISFVDDYLKTTNGEIDNTFIPFSYQKTVIHDGQPEESASLSYGYYYGGVTVHIDHGKLVEVLETEPLEDVPLTWLDYIPGWTTHFPLKDPNIYSGFFLARRVDESGQILVFGKPKDDGHTEIFTYRIKEVEGRCFTLTDEDGTVISPALFRFFQALLFFCSLIPHKPALPKVSKQTRKGGVVDYHIQPLKETREIPLDAVVSAYVAEHQTGNGQSPSSRKAHFRRAHWRSVWLGPRTGERVKDMRWIPATIVRGYKPE